MSEANAERRDGMTTGVRLWITGLTLGATACLIVAATRDAVGDVWTPVVPALVLGLALTDLLPLWDTGRPRNVHITVTELFTGASLMLLDPGAAVLVAALGAIASLALRSSIGPMRHVPSRSPWVTLHSLAMPVVVTTAAVLVMLVTSAWLPLPAAAIVGMLVFTVAEALLVSTVVWLDTGIRPLQVLFSTGGGGVLPGLVAGVMGVLLGNAVVTESWGWLVVLGAAALVPPTSGRGMQLARERLERQTMLAAALGTSRHKDATRALEELMKLASEALVAERVEVTAERPEWAEVAARLGGHGWLAVADRSLRSQATFDHRDQELLSALAGVATVTLENAALMTELAQADRVRATLLAAAAHDLRNPMSAVVSSLQTIRDHPDLDDRRRDQVLAAAFSSTDKALRLVHDLIDLEQQHISPGTASGRRADVTEVVTAVFDDLRPEARERCERRVPDDLPAVRMHPALLERVVENLVANAVRHTVDGQVEVVAWRDEAARVVIAVEDHGPGIPPERRQQLLAPFARGATSQSGFGLGLHIAHEFVTTAGGSLTITDRDDGPGASFRVRLPVAGGEEDDGAVTG